MKENNPTVEKKKSPILMNLVTYDHKLSDLEDLRSELQLVIENLDRQIEWFKTNRGRYEYEVGK